MRGNTLLQAMVAELNANHPVGTPVVRFKLANPPKLPVETRTASEAFVYRSSAWVMVEGVIGPVELETVLPNGESVEG